MTPAGSLITTDSPRRTYGPVPVRPACPAVAGHGAPERAV